MDGDETKTLGRRALLAAGAAGVAAAAAQAVAPAGVRGDSVNPVRLGHCNFASFPTTVYNGSVCPDFSKSNDDAFAGASQYGNGLRGMSQHANRSGVYGESGDTHGYGVYGINVPSGAAGWLGSKDHGAYGYGKDAEGVHGESVNNYGVMATSGGEGKAGALGTSSAADGSGIEGRNSASHTYGHLGGAESGVYGTSPVAGAPAVAGEHPDPTGVAVSGTNTALGSTGALGSRGTALWGRAPHDLDHFGIFVTGRAIFPTAQGLLTIAKGSRSVSAERPALTGDTLVLATLQQNRAGVYIQAAVADPAAGTVTIYLNKAVPAATKVAYLVLG